MKAYISDLIPKVQRFSRKLDDLVMLTGQHWVVVDEIENSKKVYIFRRNNELLISINGSVEKAKWEYLGKNAILIDIKEKSFLFKHGFYDENILALKVDGKNEYAFLVNETKFNDELNSLNSIGEYLNKNYRQPDIQRNTQKRNTHKKDNTQLEETLIVIPNYEETLMDSRRALFGKQSKFRIEFADGVSGELISVLKSDKHRINCFGNHIYYSSKISAVNALYYFLLKKKILEKDKIDI